MCMFRFESGENNNPIHDVFVALRFRWLFSMKLLSMVAKSLLNLHTKKEADLLIGPRELLWYRWS